MTRGYVLVSLGSGRTEDVLSEVREIEGVNQADAVVGAYDVIVEVEAQSEQALLLLVTDKIHSLPSAGRARTCLVRE